MSRGALITFEGGEGTGKSTQLLLLKELLETAGADVVTTREPGGTSVGESVRTLLLDPDSAGITPHAELLLYEAARAQLVSEVIAPALEVGSIVLCDRFYDSTTAYQGHARGIDLELIASLNMAATGGLVPDLTLVYDLPAETGLTRATSNQAADRLESEDLVFHESVAEGFRAIAGAESDRVLLVDASGTVDEVFARTLTLVSRLPQMSAVLGESPRGEGTT